MDLLLAELMAVKLVEKRVAMKAVMMVEKRVGQMTVSLVDMKAV